MEWIHWGSFFTGFSVGVLAVMVIAAISITLEEKQDAKRKANVRLHSRLDKVEEDIETVCGDMYPRLSAVEDQLKRRRA